VTGQYRITTEKGISGKSHDLFAGVQLNWVLFDGGERMADRDERVADAAASELETEALSRRIGIDVHRALALLDRGKAEAGEAQVAAVAARKNSVESYVLYKQGLLPALAAADAALQLFNAEVELVRAQYGVATALLDLRAALGFDPFGREPR
jgi:outer membrane protein TolC